MTGTPSTWREFRDQPDEFQAAVESAFELASVAYGTFHSPIQRSVATVLEGVEVDAGTPFALGGPLVVDRETADAAGGHHFQWQSWKRGQSEPDPARYFLRSLLDSAYPTALNEGDKSLALLIETQRAVDAFAGAVGMGEDRTCEGFRMVAPDILTPSEREMVSFQAKIGTLSTPDKDPWLQGESLFAGWWPAEGVDLVELGRTWCRLAARLVRARYGIEGAELGTKLEERAESADPWAPFRQQADGPPKWLLALARAAWRGKVERDLKPPAPLEFEFIRGEDGDQYATVTKVAAGIGWSFGAPGVGVEVDGDQYAEAPAPTRWVSRGCAVLPRGKRPSQMALEVGYQGNDTGILAVRALADTQHVISPGAAKALTYAMVVAPRGGQSAEDLLCHATLEDMTSALHPGRARTRDMGTVAGWFRDLRGVEVVLPDGTSFALMDVRAPQDGRETPESPIVFGWSLNAHAAFNQIKASDPLRSFRGDFMINLSGGMRIGANHPVELRGYVHAAATWNEARSRDRNKRYQPQFNPHEDLETLAMRINAFSQAALDYRRDKRGNRVRASKDKGKVLRAFEALHDRKLAVLEVEGQGRRRRYRLSPPEALLEAHRTARARGQRKGG